MSSLVSYEPEEAPRDYWPRISFLDMLGILLIACGLYLALRRR